MHRHLKTLFSLSLLLLRHFLVTHWTTTWWGLTLGIWILASPSTSAPDSTSTNPDTSISSYYGPGVVLAWIAANINILVLQLHAAWPYGYSGDDEASAGGLEFLPAVLYVVPVMVDVFVQKSAGNTGQYGAALAVLRLASFFSYMGQIVVIGCKKEQYMTQLVSTLWFGMMMLPGFRPKPEATPEGQEGKGKAMDVQSMTVLLLWVSATHQRLKSKEEGKPESNWTMLWRGLKNVVYDGIFAVMGGLFASLTWACENRGLPVSGAKLSDLDQFMALVPVLLGIVVAWRRELWVILKKKRWVRLAVDSVGVRQYMERENESIELPVIEHSRPTADGLEDSDMIVELGSYRRHSGENPAQTESPIANSVYELE